MTVSIICIPWNSSLSGVLRYTPEHSPYRVGGRLKFQETIMNTLVKITLFAALLLSIVVPFAAFAAGEKRRGRYKRALSVNLFSFFGLLLFTALLLFSGSAYAAETAEAAGKTVSGAGLGYIGAALSVGLSCIGGGIAVSSAASAALGAISEDSSVLGKSLIFVGLAEGVCLYGLIIAFMILGQL